MNPLTFPARALGWASIGLVTVVAGLLLLPATRESMKSLLDEGHVVEWLTFATLLLAGFGAVGLTAGRQRWWVKIFYLIFGLLLIITAAEEVAWGQQIFGFETPSFLRAINRQGEATLHNIGGLQERSEYFRIIFGLGGLAGVLLRRSKSFAELAPPPTWRPSLW